MSSNSWATCSALMIDKHPRPKPRKNAWKGEIDIVEKLLLKWYYEMKNKFVLFERTLEMIKELHV